MWTESYGKSKITQNMSVFWTFLFSFTKVDKYFAQRVKSNKNSRGNYL